MAAQDHWAALPIACTELAPMSLFPRLLADIGGTHARFAWQVSSATELSHVAVLPCEQFATLADAIQSYLQRHTTAPRAAAIAIANPVDGDRVTMTNRDWSFSIRELQQQLGLEVLLVCNDFTALAMSIPTLKDTEKRAIGGGTARADGAIALLGPGTGLGVSGLVRGRQGEWIALASEGGHVTACATTAREWAVIERLQSRHGHVSAERIVSGLGIEEVYAALCEIEGQAAVFAGAPAITQAARMGDPLARETLDMFCAQLGAVAGNLALTLGARGGVYVGGGIAARLADYIAQSAFRARFEAKGRFQRYLADIPTWIITAEPSPALRGAAVMLAQQLQA
jgi:glucokinase